MVNPKVACTSFLWLVAGLQGEDGERFHRSFSPEVTRSFTVHDKALWANTPDLADLSDEALEEIGPERGWFVFALARQPLSRLWSAWVSKLLMREPTFVNQFGTKPWFPRRPEDSQSVNEDFKRFVFALRDDPELLGADGHWMPQSDVLNMGAMNYSHIGRLEDVGTTLALLEQHLVPQGWSGHLELPHSNRGVLRMAADGFDRETVAAVERVYTGDYQAFGYQATMAPGATPEPAARGGSVPGLNWADALNEIIDRHDRYADLFEIAAALYHALGSTTSQLEEARKAVAVMEGRLERAMATRSDLEQRLLEQAQIARDFRLALKASGAHS